MQTTSKVLMVRPARFAYNEETARNNYFQQRTDTENVNESAIAEFDAFVKLLRGNDVDVTVVQDTPEPWTPDSVFPNNWFSSHLGGELVLYPMFAENRRLERKPHVMDVLLHKMNHRKIVDLTHWEKQGEFLEGTGSMIFDREKRIAYCCGQEGQPHLSYQCDDGSWHAGGCGLFGITSERRRTRKTCCKTHFNRKDYRRDLFGSGRAFCREHARTEKQERPTSNDHVCHSTKITFD
jgi:hypothetical protein